jgi:hypothetical protein
MKIVTLIPSYLPKLNVLGPIVQDISKVSEVFIFSPDSSVQSIANWIPCDPNLKENLVFEPRKWINDNLHKFDYVLYNEDDIVIKSQQIEHAIYLQRQLPAGQVTGFLRYEMYKDERRYIDLHPAHSVHTGGNGVSDILIKLDQNWFQPWNAHSGNFLLSNSQIKELKLANRWDTYFGENGITYWKCLESGASSVYRYFQKVLPVNYSAVAVEHLSDKYGYSDPTPNDDKLIALLK